MRLTEAALGKLMTRFKNALKGAGVKMTHQRIEIYKELAQSADHPDAEMIFRSVSKKMPTISRDTVYRTLWMFTNLGLITTLGSPKKRIQFDANMAHHHHFVCEKCGDAKDFFSNDFNDLSIPLDVRELGRVSTSHVEFRGVCAHCLKKGKT